MRRFLLRFCLGPLPLIAMLTGCNLHPAEPRQRQEYSDPPVQYGETRFSGMKIESAPDAGSVNAR